MVETFDLVIIGGGPAGYVGAIRAAQLGLKTALVEKRTTLGGTCLNVGCIPSKAMLQSSHHFEVAKNEFSNHGIITKGLKIDLPAMLRRKNQVVSDLTKGIDFLIKKNKITHFFGEGKLITKNEVEVQAFEESRPSNALSAKNVLIATGSQVTPLPGIEIDEKFIVSSTGALALDRVPRKMVVVGAGVIGLELGSVWRRLGSEVVVVEYLDGILPGMDHEISNSMLRILKKQGLKFRLGTKVNRAKINKNKAVLNTMNLKNNEEENIDCDIALIAVGRSPFTDGLGLHNIGVNVDKSGFIEVDEKFNTSVNGIFAVGDVIGGAMLAHKAEEEASVCVEMIAGQSGHINYDSIPGIVYTHPEVASVGKTEDELKRAGVKFNIGKFPFTANSRARCNSDSDGFVKIIAEDITDDIIGCHIIGPSAGDLIQEIVVAMELSASAEDIARICHGHPGLPEAIKEAALGVEGRAVHI